MLKFHQWLQTLFLALAAPLRTYPLVMSFWLLYAFFIGLFIGFNL